MDHKQFNLKAVACDFDHTLTDERAWLNLNAVKLIRKLEEQDIRVVLITSRDFMTAGSLSMSMGACGVVAAEDGTVIGSVFDFSTPPRVLGDPANIERGLEVLRQVEGERLLLFNWPGRICSACLYRIDDLSVEQGNAILAERGVRARLLDSGVAYLLIDSCTNKGRGLRETAKILGLAPENFLAIGDNFNDIDMFVEAGYSVAVGNAPQTVKDRVDYVCKANYGDGFCEGVNHVLELYKPDWR